MDSSLDRPLARYASLANYAELTRTLGADPTPLIRASGLDPAGMSLHDRWVPASSMIDLIERTASIVNRDDFGYRLAELRRLSHLGPLSLVLREEPDVRSALTVLSRHESMYNQSLHSRLSETDGIARVQVTLEIERVAPLRQSTDFAVGVLYGLLRELLGSTWVPVAVGFTHPEPVHSDTPKRMFGGVARYDQEYNGIVLSSTDLDRPSATSDPLLRQYSRQVLAAAPAAGAQAVERARQAVDVLLPTGRCSADLVARSLGVDRRTLHRHLSAEGTTFTGVVDDARADLARALVAGRRYSFTQIASMLAFSSPSNFARWFRGRFDCTPRDWRAQNST